MLRPKLMACSCPARGRPRRTQGSAQARPAPHKGVAALGQKRRDPSALCGNSLSCRIPSGTVGASLRPHSTWTAVTEHTATGHSQAACSTEPTCSLLKTLPTGNGPAIWFPCACTGAKWCLWQPMPVDSAYTANPGKPTKICPFPDRLAAADGLAAHLRTHQTLIPSPYPNSFTRCWAASLLTSPRSSGGTYVTCPQWRWPLCTDRMRLLKAQR